jgi:hypothetical protein
MLLTYLPAARSFRVLPGVDLAMKLGDLRSPVRLSNFSGNSGVDIMGLRDMTLATLQRRFWAMDHATRAVLTKVLASSPLNRRIEWERDSSE